MSWQSFVILTIISLLTTVSSFHRAHAQDPKVPPGVDPGLEPIAVFTTGLDYTAPALASRLARDGEGELIAWDFVDSDRRPFAKSPNATLPEWGGDGTVALGQYLASADGARLSVIPVRIDLADAASFGRALAFVSQTRAKVAVVPVWNGQRDLWEPFRLAAERFAGLTLMVPECAGPASQRPRYPADLALANLKRVVAGTPNPSALDRLVLTPCGPAELAPTRVPAFPK